MIQYSSSESTFQTSAKQPISNSEDQFNRLSLSLNATNTLVCSFLVSRLDYRNSLPAGSPKYLLRKLQKIQNIAARVIVRSSKLDNVSPLLHALHWRPVHQVNQLQTLFHLFFFCHWHRSSMPCRNFQASRSFPTASLHL